MTGKTSWLIYGANGYTGELIAREAALRGMAPVLAGRNRASVEKLAKELGLGYRVFGLDDFATVKKNLQDCTAVLNCAGPFNRTSRVMARAAIESGCHYLDITGEISVFEFLASQNEYASSNLVMLLPGVGFDVVPTDCMALHLKKAMPDAIKLELAFVGPNKAAAGSIKTALAQLPYGSKVRKGGAIISVPHFSKKRVLNIETKKYKVYTIPWGDVCTGWHTTGIPDITVYTAFPREQVFGLKLAQPLSQALRNRRVLKVAETVVEKVVPAPGEDYLETGWCYIWGEVSNRAGTRLSSVFRAKDTYSMTIETALIIVRNVLEGNVEKGFQTPARLYGENLVYQVPGTVKIK